MLSLFQHLELDEINEMIVKMESVEAIYIAIESLISLVVPEKAIYTRITIDVTRKDDRDKSVAEDIHFLFHRPRGNYIAVYWACSKEKVFFPSQIPLWTRSAYNDGIQVVGRQGIGGPICEISEQLLKKLGGKDDPQAYEAEASWLLSQPEPVKVKNVTKLNNRKGFDFKYKIEVEK